MGWRRLRRNQIQASPSPKYGGRRCANTALDFGLQVPEPPAVRPWFNEPRPQDVNNDTKFTVIDAVAVINFLNSAPSGTISTVPLNSEPGKPFGFIDTDGNNIISVNDALRVINRLNTPGGEGESDSEDSTVPQLATSNPISATSTRRRKPISPAAEMSASGELIPLAVDAALESWQISNRG